MGRNALAALSRSSGNGILKAAREAPPASLRERRETNMQFLCHMLAAMLISTALLAAPAAAQSYYGAGNEVTEPFSLEGGSIVLDVKYDGTGPFAVRLTEARGEWNATLVDTAGAMEVIRELQIPRAGDYQLRVTASGPWRIALSDPHGGDEADRNSPVVMRAQGAYDASVAARKLGGAPYLLGGLLGGALAGPLGAGAAVAVAGARSTDMPADLELRLSEADPSYTEAFREAFPARLRSARRANSLIGGAAGSMVFFFLLVQLASWDSDGGSPGPGPGGPELP